MHEGPAVREQETRGRLVQQRLLEDYGPGSRKIGEVDVLVLVGRRWGLGLGLSGGSEV